MRIYKAEQTCSIMYNTLSVNGHDQIHTIFKCLLFNHILVSAKWHKNGKYTQNVSYVQIKLKDCFQEPN